MKTFHYTQMGIFGETLLPYTDPEGFVTYDDTVEDFPDEDIPTVEEAVRDAIECLRNWQ